jgi:hypothetical protein
MATSYTADRITNGRASREALLARHDALSRLFDIAFLVPGTNVRFGIEAVMRLVPGIGDAAASALSCCLLYEAQRLGMPPRIFARMLLNVAIEGIVGVVPIAGDAFDVRSAPTAATCASYAITSMAARKARPRRGALLQPLDDAEIPLGGVVEHLQRRLIGRAVVTRDGRRHAVELDHHHALLDAGLVDLRRAAAREEARAGGGERRPGELGVFRHRIRIRDRAIA